MASEIENLREELSELRKDVAFIKHALAEDYELSEEAKQALRRGRNAPKSEFIELK